MDNTSAVPVVPVVAPAGDTNAKPVLSDDKVINTPADKLAADKVVAKTPAEKEVIRKIKVGDQEYDEGILASMIEKAKGADKKFLEAAKARKEAIRFFKMAKDNPQEFLERNGVDTKKLSYDTVAKDIQDKLRDPREVELDAANKRLQEFEKKEATENERQRAEKLTREAKALEARFHAEIIDALESTPSIPKNGFSVAKIAKYIDTVRDKTGILLAAKEVVNVIDRDIRGEVSGILKGATAEQIIELIGVEGAELIRQYHLAQLKNPLSGNNGANSQDQEKPKAKRWNNSHDFWKTIDKAAKAERGE